MRIGAMFTVLLVGCAGSEPAPTPPKEAASRLEIANLENLYRVTPRLYSGGAPEGDEAFEELKKLSITTVISVDAMSPDVATAERFGMKYVHLPIGYDGVPTPMAYKLAKAVQVSPGPVYLHCHHGLHRGPTAVAVIRLCLEPGYTPAEAVAWMQQAGTDAKYKGLFRMPTLLVRPDEQKLAELPSEFPSKVEVPDLTRAMIQVNEHFRAIKAAQKKDWLGADLAAIALVEDYRDARRTLAASSKGDAFHKQMIDAEANAKEFADLVKANNLKDAPAVFAKMQAICTECHSKYRD